VIETTAKNFFLYFG